MSRIELKHIDKFYGSNHVLRDINLTIEDGDFMTLLGPSGCGKTTTLRVVSGKAPERHHDHRRRGDDQRRRRLLRRAQQAGAESGVPVLRPVAPHDGLRQHRLRPEDPEDEQGGDRPPGHGLPADDAHRYV